MNDPLSTTSSESSGNPGRVEPLDKVKMFLGVAGALAGVSVIVVMLVVLANRAVQPPQIQGNKTPAERMELLRASRAQDHELLTTYGWVDRPKGIVRIPMDVAIGKYVSESHSTPGAVTDH